MACRTAHLVALACALAAAAVSGCRRSPLANRDAAPDQAGDGPSRGDGGMGTLDIHVDTGGEAATADSEGGDLSPTPDALDAPDAPLGDAPADSPVEAAVDAPRETTVDAPVDAPPDAPIDLPTGDAPAERAGDSGADARLEDQPCGPQRINCAPYACDVTGGTCKTICFSNDDCFEQRPCRQGICGNRAAIACTTNGECMSGFCAQGVCCQTACNQVCHSCAPPTSLGSCQPVPANNPDPEMRCPAGDVCDGYGQCVPSSCTVATDCGRYHSCFNGHCSACFATCATSADCAAPNVCYDNNGCTRCGPADAGTD